MRSWSCATSSYLSPSARCAPVNGLAGCYVSTIGKPHEYFDLTGLPSIRRAIRVLNLAEINEDPIAKLVLAVSTIEGLATDPPWTDGERELIDSAAAWLERTHGYREEAMQVLEAVQQVRRESIRQRIRKLLQANDLSNVWRDWDRLYSKRSGLFHGRSEAGSEHRGSHLEESSLRALGEEAIKLCARIVLSMPWCTTRDLGPRCHPSRRRSGCSHA